MSLTFLRTVALLILSANLIAVPSAQQSSKKTKAQNLTRKLTTVQTKKKAVQKQLHTVKVAVRGVASEVENLDAKITNVEDKLADTKTRLNGHKKEQTKLSVELDKAHRKLIEKKAIAGRRLRSIYVSGNKTVLSVLIGSRTVADFASRKSLLERIAKHDHELFDDVKSLRDEIALKKKRQDKLVDSVAELKARQQMQEQDLHGAMAQKRVVLVQLKAQRNDLQEELEEMERESSRIEVQIRAYQQANSGRVTPYKGHFMLPVRGRFSSPFGYRTHPISGKHKLHTGLDIAAPQGTIIRAAGSGVVISTGWRGGYGNTVIIDHGGGISTLYGHCSRIIARDGQRVRVGDSIAAVGSTGYSTGPHLHFEVRVNGTPVNPRKYL